MLVKCSVIHFTPGTILRSRDKKMNETAFCHERIYDKRNAMSCISINEIRISSQNLILTPHLYIQCHLSNSTLMSNGHLYYSALSALLPIVMLVGTSIIPAALQKNLTPFFC